MDLLPEAARSSVYQDRLHKSVMDSPREFIYYTHPSQFQDKQHRKQVKSYVSTRAYWVERRHRMRIDPKCQPSDKDPSKEVEEDLGVKGEKECSLKFITHKDKLHNFGQETSKSNRGVSHDCPFHSTAVPNQRSKNATSNWHKDIVAAISRYSVPEQEPKFSCSKCQRARLLLTGPPITSINSLPEVLRQSEGFRTASEFYLDAVDPHYPPICQIFDVVNCFGSNYHNQMRQDEDALHAGVAAVQVMKGMFTSTCAPSQLPEDVLRLVHVAISRLRERIARNDRCNDETTIMTVVFLTHLAMAFRDMAAFQSHRKALRQIIDSRGGLHKLNKDSLVTSTVRQFELGWCSLYGGGIFEEEERRVTSNLRYPKLPFPQEIAQLVSRLPAGFQRLTEKGELSMEIVVLLSRVTYYTRLEKTDKSLLSRLLLAGASNNQRTFNTFNEACPALSIPGPSLEKFLSHALMLYCCLTFSPKRSLLEACNLIFSIPRVILVRELPSFDADARGSGESPEEMRCLQWIWLVLIASLIIANTKRSTLGRDLAAHFVGRHPAYRKWGDVEEILNGFFASEVVVGSLRAHWIAMGWE